MFLKASRGRNNPLEMYQCTATSITSVYVYTDSPWLASKIEEIGRISRNLGENTASYVSAG